MNAGKTVASLSLAASFALSFATWVDLAVASGFTGTVDAMVITLRLAWAMPVCVDGYVVASLIAWLAPVSERTARFARANTYAAALVGVVAQSAWHATAIHTLTGSAWRSIVACVVGALPPLLAALGVHMHALTRRELRDREVAPTPEVKPADPVEATAATEAPDPATAPPDDVPAPATPPERPARTKRAPGSPRRPRGGWDRDAAVAALVAGTDPAEVAGVVGVHVTTVKRLRRALVEQGVLQA